MKLKFLDEIEFSGVRLIDFRTKPEPLGIEPATLRIELSVSFFGTYLAGPKIYDFYSQKFNFT